MSSDQQRYSLQQQAQAIAAYAQRRGLAVVRSYEDAGVSGLQAANRTGLQRLLADILGGDADYGVVLVYDVSRWGRFQNPDEGAHYEFVCRQQGVEVEYCAEEFGSEGPTARLVKQVKRVMAAEYSRQLGAGVRRGKRAGAREGYWTAGRSSYGLQRCLVDEDGGHVRVLERGEYKPLGSQRVVLRPGPAEEVAVVRRIYDLFLGEDLSRTQIVERLNAEGPAFRHGRAWTFQVVTNILSNPVYAGDIRYGRRLCDLGRQKGVRRRDDWIEVQDAFEACVPREIFLRAAARLPPPRLSDEEMLSRLAALLAREGRLSPSIIAQAEGVPTAVTYRKRFGSLARAYELVGYASPRRPRPGPAAAAAPSSPRAVQYLRMSTALQPESIALQAAAIAEHAAARGYEIVRSYEDPALSGVEARRRPAFRALLARVLAGEADFEIVLVHDVSRWGRFQNPDEAAHYEFLCAQEGVRIEYCAEPFGAGESVPDALMKSLKRMMAAEYSRELGVKIRAAQRRNSAAGYWQHGSPGYGLRRRLVDGPQMRAGERKSDRTRHTVLVAGPDEEVEVVRRMFRLCAVDGLAPGEIARRLNDEGVAAPSGGPWRPERVRAILANPKYAGDLVSQRRHTPIGGRRRNAVQEEWVVAKGAAPALVARDLFDAVQARIARLERPATDVLLRRLRAVVEAHGMVGEPQLKALGVPAYRAYRQRFGSLRAAYAAIGSPPPKHFPKRMSETEMLRGLARLFLSKGDLSPRLIDAAEDLPSTEHYRRRFGGLASAYVRIGFVRITPAQARSPLGQARLAARQAQIARWADLPDERAPP